MAKKLIKTKKKLPNINNPFVLIQVILLMIVRLITVVLGGILGIVTLAIHKWLASLIILAAVFITLYSMGVLS